MDEQTIKDIMEIFEKNRIELNIKKIYKHTIDGEKIELYSTNTELRRQGNET